MKFSVPRPCLYCDRFYSNLKDHLMRRHRNEDLILQASLANTKEQNKIIDYVRNKGIDKVNEKNDYAKDSLIVKRRQGNQPRAKCEGCYNIISKKSFYEHRQKCIYLNSNQKNTRNGGRKELPVTAHLDHVYQNMLSQDFKNVILEGMMCDRITSFIRKDKEILQIGNDFFMNKRQTRKNKEKSVKRQTRLLMRTNASLFLECKAKLQETAIEISKLSELFRRKYFHVISSVIEKNIQLSEDDVSKRRKNKSANQNIKTGAAGNYETQLRRATECLINIFDGEEEDEICERLRKFSEHLKNNITKTTGAKTTFNFAASTNKQMNSGNIDREAAKSLILYADKEVTELSCLPFTSFDRSKYIRLRKALLTKTMVINGNRPNEWSEMSLEEYENAESALQITQQEQNTMSDEDIHRLEEWKVIITLSGKVAGAPPTLFFYMDC